MKIRLGIALVLFPFSASADEVLTHWKMLPEKSSIEWMVNYSGKPLKGSFPEFAPDIIFDPAHLDKSSVNVGIETTKIKSSDKDARESLPSGEWFAAAKYPAASFRSDNFRHISGDNYEAEGTLIIRDKPVKVTLPFSVRISDHYAVMDGQTTVKRLDFGIGTGEWQKTDAVANEVKVSIHIEAKAY